MVLFASSIISICIQLHQRRFQGVAMIRYQLGYHQLDLPLTVFEQSLEGQRGIRRLPTCTILLRRVFVLHPFFTPLLMLMLGVHRAIRSPSSPVNMASRRYVTEWG
jgi:hypothetical protein